MKSIKMFGKSIPLVAIMLTLMLTLGASAYLATYLSDSVTADVTVISPMEVGLSLGKPSWSTTECWRSDTSEYVLSFPEGKDQAGDPICDWGPSDWTKTGILVIPDIMGGETITLYFMSANLADATIIAHEEIRISNPGGITSGDFELITTRFDSIYGDNGWGTLHSDNLGPEDVWAVPYTGGNCIEMWKASDTSQWGEGETDVAMWNITFNDAASGTYTFSYQITPALVPP